MQRHQPADKFAPNHKAFRFQIIHHLASAHSRMLRVLMVNLTHNLKVPVRFALKRFVVVHAVGKPQCVTLLLDGKALVTRGYHSSAASVSPFFASKSSITSSFPILAYNSWFFFSTSSSLLPCFPKTAPAFFTRFAFQCDIMVGDTLYFFANSASADVFPIFDDKVKCFYLS